MSLRPPEQKESLGRAAPHAVLVPITARPLSSRGPNSRMTRRHPVPLNQRSVLVRVIFKKHDFAILAAGPADRDVKGWNFCHREISPKPWEMRLWPRVARRNFYSDGQRIATRAPSSISWHGPIWCGRSTINTPDGFRRQPAGAGKPNAGQPLADHPQETARAGILRLATSAFYRGALRLATGQKSVAIAMIASTITTRTAEANVSTSFGMAVSPKEAIAGDGLRRRATAGPAPQSAFAPCVGVRTSHVRSPLAPCCVPSSRSPDPSSRSPGPAFASPPVRALQGYWPVPTCVAAIRSCTLG